MNKTIIFVPYWICNTLKRNNRLLGDVLDYDVCRKFISVDDISGLLGFQQIPELAGYTVSTDISLLSRWESTTGNRLELDSTVIPLSHSKEKDVLERLKNTSGYDDQLPVFKVVDIERDFTAVIVNEGFMEAIKNNSTKKSLIDSLLDVSYKYGKIHDVSKTPLFRAYMDLL